jgi:hypothetical protein
LPRSWLFLGSGLAVAVLSWRVLGWAIGVLLLTVTVVVTWLVVRRQAAQELEEEEADATGRLILAPWEPSVEHPELPPPDEDPLLPFSPPALDQVASRIPLEEAGLPARLRMQLDAFGLGLAKRVLDAPDLLRVAAAEPDVWPLIESVVGDIFAAAAQRGLPVDPRGAQDLSAGLSLCVAQGLLLAEWHVLENGLASEPTAPVRASRFFALARLAETAERRMLVNIIPTLPRRDAAFQPYPLVHFALAAGFHRGLGQPPSYFQGIVAGERVLAGAVAGPAA